MIDELKKDLKKFSNSEKAKILQRFFKTGKGEYGEGDVFIGVNAPDIRKLVKKYKDISLKEIQELLNDRIHEYRVISLRILEEKYSKASEIEKEKIIKLYLKNTRNINNWDLVDLSAPKILGEYLFNREKDILYKLAGSKNLWEKRIAILSTLAFIRNNSFDDALNISKILLNDKHDLIHKAVGWMLREVGNRDQKIEEEFLKEHCLNMPRTMLRYAIEKFEENKRQAYLKNDIY